MRTNELLLFLLMLLNCHSIYGRQDNSRVYFSELKNATSLANTDIYSITMDNVGFVWIGTEDGLFKYDGYQLNQIRDIGMLEITCIIPDSKGGLWLGGDGLKYFDTRTNNFKNIDLKGNLVVRTLYDDGNYLWIGTESGLVRLNKEIEAIKLFTNKNSKLSNNIIRTIYKDKKENLWVGTSDRLNKLERKATTFVSYDLKRNYKPEIIYNHILDIEPYSEYCDSLLWVGTETGLCLFNIDNGTFIHYNEENSNISNNAIKCIHNTGIDKLWLGTDFGLYLFDIKSGNNEVYLHQPEKLMSITNNVIWTIYQDSGGILWFGTSNGLNRIITGQNRFEYLPVRTTINGFEIGEQVKDIVPLNNGSVWVGTNHGAYLYNFGEGIVESFSGERGGERNLGFDKIQAVHTDDLNRLWIGSVGGIFIWDNTLRRMFKITSENKNAKELKSNYINKFIQANDGSFWLSVWQNGFYRISGDFMDPEQLNIQLILEVNTDLIVAGEKYIWIIDNNKLLRFNPKYNKAEPVDVVNQIIDKDYIRSIYYSSSGKLWLGGENAIFEYHSGQNEIIRHEIESQQGIKILSIEEDVEGNLWMSSQNSILCFNIQERETQIYVLGNEFLLNGFISGCSAKISNGRILFGGNDGMIMFDPSEIEKNTYSPNLVISSFKIYDKDIKSGDTIHNNNILKQNITFLKKLEIPYDLRSFTISFSSLHLGSPEKNVYSYKLEGLDERWHTLTNSNEVTYSGLPPNRYTFRVKGTNNDGIWLDKEAKIDIQILPPLWRRWEFITGLGIIIFGILLTILHFFIQKRKLARKIEVEQAEKRNIALLNQAKIQFFTNVSHEFRTPLSLIVGPVKKLSQDRGLNEENKQLVNLISKNGTRMLHLVNQLMDFRKISSNVCSIIKSESDLILLTKESFELFVENSKEKGLIFIFQSNCESLKLKFDKQKIETVLFNLLSNAFKYTLKGKILLEVNLVQSEDIKGPLEIIISDTGVGIEKEKLSHIFQRFYSSVGSVQNEMGTGIGLNIVKEYVELHNGNIKVASILGKGTSFKVTIPLENDPIEYKLGKFVIEVSPKIKVPIDKFESQDRKVILVVEDNPEMATFISECLKSHYTVLVEYNGADGREKAEQLLPDLIISDIMMPLKSGTDLCNELKSDIKTSHIPVVLLTALQAVEQQKEGFDIGADDYILKPFNEELLLTRISGILRNRELLKKKFQLDQTINPKELSISTPDEDFLNAIMQNIEDNIQKRDLSAAFLSQELGMSHSFVYKKLKSLTGQSIVDFIRDFKLKRAAQLLSKHGFSVTDTCYEVGFSDRRYFTRIFKQKFGKSPSEYRREIKGENRKY